MKTKYLGLLTHPVVRGALIRAHGESNETLKELEKKIAKAEKKLQKGTRLTKKQRKKELLSLTHDDDSFANKEDFLQTVAMRIGHRLNKAAA